METVTINASINEHKKVEFFHTMESLKSLVKNYCNSMEAIINDDGSLIVMINFNNEKELKNNFDNDEFKILKGTVRSLCHNITIKINDKFKIS
jgi:hypothetical protein